MDRGDTRTHRPSIHPAREGPRRLNYRSVNRVLGEEAADGLDQLLHKAFSCPCSGAGPHTCPVGRYPHARHTRHHTGHPALLHGVQGTQMYSGDRRVDTLYAGMYRHERNIYTTLSHSRGALPWVPRRIMGMWPTGEAGPARVGCGFESHHVHQCSRTNKANGF